MEVGKLVSKVECVGKDAWLINITCPGCGREFKRLIGQEHGHNTVHCPGVCGFWWFVESITPEEP